MSGALFLGMFDDAALFPPGSAPMGGALPAHREHRAGPRAPYVGPFVVSAARVAELGAFLAREGGEPLEVAVTVPEGAAAVAGAVSSVLSFPSMRLAAVEVTAPPGGAAEAAARLTEHLPEGADGFVEVARGAGARVDLKAVAGSGHSAKFRTGGLNAEAHPGEAELAGLMGAAVELDVPFKCTAGLHRAVRHTTEEGFEQHGFLNVLLAVHTLLDGRGTEAAAQVLADRGAAGLAARAAALAHGEAARVRAVFRSFGTCSVTEPLEDLAALGLLPAHH